MGYWVVMRSGQCAPPPEKGDVEALTATLSLVFFSLPVPINRDSDVNVAVIFCNILWALVTL